MKLTVPLIVLSFSAASSFAQDYPIDKKATKETVNLYHSLKRMLGKGIFFGHQDDLAYGATWKYEPGRSDVKDVTGDYPAVYGWELGQLELDNPTNLDSVPFDKMKHFIKQGYRRGGIITISWHLNNPLTGKSAWDPAEGTVASILPGGEKNKLFTSWLDKVAEFLSDLKGDKGEFIPVLFRPFHELNGSWFWWGRNHCTPDELKRLYQFTVGYLRDEKQIHHLLYAYNTDRFSSREAYLERYPGDEWVDVIGFDIYQRGNDNSKFIKDIDGMLSMLTAIAAEKNKIPALTEFGYEGIPDANWWMDTFWKGIEKHNISFVLAWRNGGLYENGTKGFFAPYKEHTSAASFKKFYNLRQTLFQSDTRKLKIYQ